MSLDYELIKHAKNVMRERNIPLNYLEQTISYPDYSFQDETYLELEHRLKSIKEYDKRVLRVIINVSTKPMRIVTLFFDRRVGGKI
jgi:hypothetical protein